MHNYVISTCSTADLSLEHLKSRDIDFIKFSFYIDDKQFKDDMGQSIPYEAFYEQMKNGSKTSTSQPNVDEFKDFLTPHLKNGKDIILLVLSSGLSGAMTSAKIAKEELSAEYPDRKIYVVDSLGASSGMGLLVDEMATRRDEGMTIDELYQWTEENKLNVHYWFFTTDLTYLVRGGRVSKAAGWFGTILKICPLLNVDKDGKLTPREKVRGKAGVIKQAVKKMEENAINGQNYSDKCYISHSMAYDDAKELAIQIEEKFPNLKGKIVINNIGTTIGSHTGPGTVALFFMGKKREN
jgi:DegV family protein with EDD domain